MAGAGMGASLTGMTFSVWMCGDDPINNTLLLAPVFQASGPQREVQFLFQTVPAASGFATATVTISGINIGTFLQTVAFSGIVPLCDVTPGAFNYTSSTVNFLLSFDPTVSGGALQVYANDTLLPLTVGGWLFPTAINNVAGAWAFPAIAATATGVADFWADDTAHDLSITGNRRQWIKADLSAVAIASDGRVTLDTGSVTPIIFLHTTNTGSANNFTANNGTGPAWAASGPALTFEPDNCLVIVPVPAPSCGAVHTGATLTAAWTLAGSAVSYTLDYRKLGDTLFTEITGIVTTSYLLTGLTSGTIYEFKVKALFVASESPFSALTQCSTTGAQAVTLAELWFGQTAAFADPTQDAIRGKFYTVGGGARNLGLTGQNPFGVSPSVYMSRRGPPATFAANNGRGGAFTIVAGPLDPALTNPPGSTTITTTVQPNSPGQGVLGDYLTGNLYAFNPETLTDNGTQRRWLRRWRALPKTVATSVRFSWLNVLMQTGINVPEGTKPQVVLRWSDDGGFTFSDERIVAVGAKGQTRISVKFNRLGMTRRFSGSDRVFELSSTDPFGIAILDAEVEAS